MVNHPNRKRDYPNTEMADIARAAGAYVRLLWEIPGPKDTMVAWLSCYAVGKGMVIVQTYKNGDGWMCLTPCPDTTIEGTMADVLNRCGVPVKESGK